MTTDCNTNLFVFTEVEGREVVAGFDGGAITSDARRTAARTANRASGLISRFAACFHDEGVQSLRHGRVRVPHQPHSRRRDAHYGRQRPRPTGSKFRLITVDTGEPEKRASLDATALLDR